MIVKKSREEFQSYLEDTSNVKGDADTLYIPETPQDVSAILKYCGLHKIPLTCSGARTGTTAGCVPLGGALLSLEKLNALSVDVATKTLYAQAGASLAVIEQHLHAIGLTFKAQPTESLAFIGGAAATCASGVRGFRYGSIRRYIRKLGVILIDGTALHISRGDTFAQGRNFSFTLGSRSFRFTLPTYRLPSVKTQAGYYVVDNMDLIDLFIGSEGTLGIITDVMLDVQSTPYGIFDGVAFFADEDAAFCFVDTIKNLTKRGDIGPASLEFFDKPSLDFLKNSYPQIPPAECAVYFEQETSQNTHDVLMETWATLLENSKIPLEKVWFGTTDSERKKIYDFRHALPQHINEFLRIHKQTKLSTDIALPEENFRVMYEFYKEKALHAKIPFVNFGHIGENHLHFNFLPRDKTEYLRAQEIMLIFTQKGISLGGTISAEHGIGKLKKLYLEIMYGKGHIREMALLKRYFDPDFLLNRGNIFD